MFTTLRLLRLFMPKMNTFVAKANVMIRVIVLVVAMTACLQAQATMVKDGSNAYVSSGSTDDMDIQLPGTKGFGVSTVQECENFVPIIKNICEAKFFRSMSSRDRIRA